MKERNTYSFEAMSSNKKVSSSRNTVSSIDYLKFCVSLSERKSFNSKKEKSISKKTS